MSNFIIDKATGKVCGIGAPRKHGERFQALQEAQDACWEVFISLSETGKRSKARGAKRCVDAIEKLQKGDPQ